MEEPVHLHERELARSNNGKPRWGYGSISRASGAVDRPSRGLLPAALCSIGPSLAEAEELRWKRLPPQC